MEPLPIKIKSASRFRPENFLRKGLKQIMSRIQRNLTKKQNKKKKGATYARVALTSLTKGIFYTVGLEVGTKILEVIHLGQYFS